jgi:hypothetical protein
MKYFKILLIIGVLLGGVVGSVVEVPSYAAGSIVKFREGEYGEYYYFPNTGYVVEAVCAIYSSMVSKYVLPKNLGISKLKNSRSNYPGVIMRMMGKNPASYKPSKWKKNWDNINMGDMHSFETVNSVNGLINYIHQNKFDVVYAKGLKTYNSRNSTAKNHELLWTTKSPNWDCGH